MPIRANLVVAWLICLASPALASEKLFLEWDNFGPDREFIMSDAMLRNDIAAREDPSKHVLVGRHDLNGDGRLELILGFETIGLCGRYEEDVHCLAKIYQPVEGGWRLIGEMYTHVADLGDGRLYIFGEDNYYNGWRVLRYRDLRYCWVDDIRHADRGTRPALLPGYYGVALNDQPCPK